MTDETVLKLGNLYFPVGAARGISQTIDLVSNGELRRTVNGDLKDITRQQNRKFISSISCSDTESPTIQGIWKGTQLVVECIQPFRQLIDPAGLVGNLIRTPVTGSVFGRAANNDKVLPTSVVGLVATFPTNVVMVEYRPILTMMVSDISEDKDEYGAVEAWSLSLEEV